MVLVQKWPFFQLFFLDNIGQENVFYDIVERKNAFLSYKNKMFEKSKNWHSSKPMVLVQKWPFLKLFFLGNLGRENVFYVILEQKDAFLSYKNKNFKKSKNCTFPNGLTDGFGPKMAILPTFLFRQYRQGKWTKKLLSNL